MNSKLTTVARLMNSPRWIAHSGHDVPAWTSALRRELIAAFRRGSMDAERCLRTYLNQGEPSILPFEAVVFLAARVMVERSNSPTGPTPAEPLWGGEVAHDKGESELAEICSTDCEELAEWIEAGRQYFFPRCRAVG